VRRISAGDGNPVVHLEGGARLSARAVVVASGVRYRRLPLDGWDEFEAAGCIHHAATELEARGYAGKPVIVIGGANSAGQASLFLAGRGALVTLCARRADIAETMSDYLVERLRADPGVTVREHTEVLALHGGSGPGGDGQGGDGPGGNGMESATLVDRDSGERFDVPAAGLFPFIGADPAAGFLPEAKAERGFLLTDTDLGEAARSGPWAALGRPPLPFETSIPRVFAVGDIRSGSMKRVAAAVGEGASAVSSVHQALAFHAAA
jgi:thioredoxin reductase (NADPH)